MGKGDFRSFFMGRECHKMNEIETIENVEKIKFYSITDTYINYLHSYDNGVQLNERNKLRPYVGLLLEMDEHKYYAPLSSYKEPKYKKKTQAFFKVYDDLAKDPVAVIKFNCMIPVLESEITYVNFEDYSHDRKYRTLLEAEYQFIKNNRASILAGAQKLYATAKKGRGYFFDTSCKFKLLESLYRDFMPSR